MLSDQQLVLTTEEKVIIVAYHLPLRVDRASNGYSIEWDDERGIDKHGMGLPLKVTYVGCIELDAVSYTHLTLPTTAIV